VAFVSFNRGLFQGFWLAVHSGAGGVPVLIQFCFRFDSPRQSARRNLAQFKNSGDARLLTFPFDESGKFRTLAAIR